jgi:hypothetical protein
MIVAAMLTDQHQDLGGGLPFIGNSRSAFGSLMMYCAASRSVTSEGDLSNQSSMSMV